MSKRAASGRAGPLNPSGRKHRVSRAWVHEHLTDPWVREARRAGYRSRAAFKLLEIDDRDRLLRPGAVVVDLGAAPGSWTQVAVERAGARSGGRGRVVAVDALPMEPVPGAHVVEGDFGDEATLRRVEAALGGLPADLVLCDMAPNLSGVAATDQARSVHLAELALDFACSHLKPGGHFLVKAFQGEGFDAFVASMREAFESVAVRKPRASRERSNEVFLLGRCRRAATLAPGAAEG